MKPGKPWLRGRATPDGAWAAPAEGDAPWCEQDGVSVGFAGTLYNAQALADTLNLPMTVPPAQLLVRGWQRWGTDLVHRLDGLYALVIRAGSRWWLYRDSSGLADLFFAETPGGQFSFASQISLLLALPGVAGRLSRAGLHEYLRFLDVTSPHTLVDGVRSVEPGQWLVWDRHGMQTATRGGCPQAAPQPDSMDAAVSELDTLLHQSLQHRLAGSGRPASFLSGGVDSALLCAMAWSQRPDLHAITVGFDTAVLDETPVAQRIAAHLGMPHRVLRFGRSDFLSAFEQLAIGAEQPVADPAGMATLLSMLQCREHFDLVLDGTGADEMAGMMPARHQRLAAAWTSRIPATWRTALVQRMGSWPALAAYQPLLDFEHPADTQIRWRGFRRPLIEALCGEPVSLDHTTFFRTYARFPRGAHFQRGSALLDAMPSDRLSQASLISGLQLAYPYTHPETNRYVRQLRTDYRFIPGQPKRILRALLARYVPQTLTDVPKHGFDFPLRDFLIGDQHFLVHRYLDLDRLRDAGLRSTDTIHHMVQAFINGDASHTFRVWALVVLSAWLERHPLSP